VRPLHLERNQTPYFFNIRGYVFKGNACYKIVLRGKNMNKYPLIGKGLTVGIILLFVGTSVIPAIAQDTEKPLPTSRSHWLYVGGDGPGNYSAIQSAINAANPGDTIFVYSGTYYENIIVNKTINLLGENKNTTIINGGGIDDVVLVCADQVNISRFTIQNSGTYYLFDAGIDVHANYTYIFDNNVSNNNRFGIVVGIYNVRLFYHNVINKNIVSNNIDTSIWIEESDYTVICNNIIFDDITEGCIYTDHSNHCDIENNTLLDSGYGISLTSSSNNTITYNVIKNCLLIGIDISYQQDSLIAFNYIENCTYNSNMGHGIKIEYQCNNNTIINNYINHTTCSGVWLFSNANNNIIKENAIKNCHYYGIAISNACNNNKIYHNNLFINVPKNAHDTCNNLWDNGYPCGGNYWDDYMGTDYNNGPNQDIPGSDGIGDSPYNISGGSNKDNYPLMGTYGPPNAHFTYTKQGMNVIFNASSSYDYDGNIVSYDWDFGDGSNGSGYLLSHTYITIGSYLVVLTVTDNEGKQDTTSKIILINLPPIFGSPNPTNSSTNNPLSFTWSIPINDPDGDQFSWTIQCSNGQSSSATGATNGTKTLALSGLAYTTTYKVWVNATDPTGSGLYTRKWYTFTTKGSLPPVFGTPSPANSSTNNPLSFTWSIPINDPEGDTFSWTIQCSNGQTNSGTGATNGTKSLALSGLAYSTTYKVWVNATDPTGSGLYTRKWYTFTTKANLPPVYGTPTPGNGSTNNPLSLSWSIPINDPEGDTFSWTIQCSNGKSSGANGASNGTKSLVLSGLAYSTTYKVWVNATDPTGSGLYARKWYTFTIKANQPPNPPTITGPAKGKVGVATDYNFTAIDPDGDEVYYFIDWGDNTNSSWIGPYSSGDQITKSHTWTKKGTYDIKAKAKDIYGNESDWATLSVKMPYSYNIPFLSFWEKLFERFPHAFPILRQLLGY
jgi:parallel beta-helix repeat protein